MNVKILVATPIMHIRIKYVEINGYFVRDQVIQGLLNVKHISSCDQLINTLTKPLVKGAFHSLKTKLMVIPTP